MKAAGALSPASARRSGGSKYLQNLTQLAKDGQIVEIQGLDVELRKVTRVLAAAAKTTGY